MQKHRRKSEFIDPEVQGALARRISVHWLLFTALATALVLGMKWLADPFTPVSQHLVDAWWSHGPALLVLLCLLPIFVFDAVKLSNRFTGPVLRLRNATRELANGQRPAKIVLRDGDFWKELAEDFNRAAERVSVPPAPEADPATGK